MSLRDTILAIPVKSRVPVEVPEWGVTLYAATITAKRQIALAAAAQAYPDLPSSAFYVAFGIEDEAGQPVFQADDIPALSEKSAAILNRLSNAVNAQDKSDDIAKNS